MPPITALLHTKNDALRLGRALETLYPCDDIVIVDHGSLDRTADLAREYGAHVLTANPGTSPEECLQSLRAGWILCLDPRESLTENLAASLFEWKSLPADTRFEPAYSFLLREETVAGWIDIPSPQVRLVPHTWNRWHEKFPVDEPSAPVLQGELLRFALP